MKIVFGKEQLAIKFIACGEKIAFQKQIDLELKLAVSLLK